MLFAPISSTYSSKNDMVLKLCLGTHLEASLAVIIKAAVIVWSRPIALWVL